MEDPITITSISSELKTIVDNLVRIKKAFEESKRQTSRLETERLDQVDRLNKLQKSLDTLLSQAKA